MRAMDYFEQLAKRYKAVIDSTAESFIIFDDTATVIEINKGAEAMFGYSPREVIGTNMIFVVPPENLQKAYTVLESIKNATIGNQFQVATDDSLIRKDGSKFDAAISISEAIVGNKRLYISIIRDVSIRKMLEREKAFLLDTLDKRVRAFEQFNYMLVHDLNAPLRAMQGFSEILEQDFQECLGEDGFDYVNRIKNAAKRMRKLIDDMLHLSRITTAEISINVDDINLSDIAATIAKILSDTTSKTVKFTVKPNMLVRGDSSLLELALSNLLENAWKFTSKKNEPIVEVGSINKNDETVFFVKDNGVGFDMKLCDKLFKAFSRLHPKTEFWGNGIGLFIVERVISLHGGKVWAEGIVGEGATFYFTLGNQK
jgi:PAS domain S-box-containing protein